jgi:SAM-dependent methyltransferase
VSGTRDSYDRIADDYAARFRDELLTKPLDRALLDALAEEVNTLGPIADVGCGPGHVAGYLHDRGIAAIGVDLSPRMIDIARTAHPDIEFVIADMCDLPVPDRSWGGIVALYSIIHIPPAQLAEVFVEFRRVLRQGATMLLSFHVGDEARHATEMLGHTVDLDFQFYDRQFVQSALEQAGFAVNAYLERLHYETEVATTRGYLMARRAQAGEQGADSQASAHPFGRQGERHPMRHPNENR